jgi:hypothetical protein
MKHNRSEVLIPSGHSRQQAKKVVLRSRLPERQKFVLFWILDQADGYVIRVGQLRNELSLGEKKWRAVRGQLAKLKILTQRRVSLADKSTCWTLNVDLGPVYQAPLSTGTARIESQVGITHDPADLEGPHDAGIARDLQFAGINPRADLKENHHSENCRGGAAQVDHEKSGVQQEPGLGALLGLGGAIRNRVTKLATGATSAQIEAAIAVMNKKRESGMVNDLDAYACGLAQRAAGGLITGVTQSDTQPSVTSILALLDGLRGHLLIGPKGPIAVVEEYHRLRELGKGGGLLGPTDASRLVLAWQAGELDLRAPPTSL